MCFNRDILSIRPAAVQSSDAARVYRKVSFCNEWFIDDDYDLRPAQNRYNNTHDIITTTRSWCWTAGAVATLWALSLVAGLLITAELVYPEMPGQTSA